MNKIKITLKDYKWKIVIKIILIKNKLFNLEDIYLFKYNYLAK